MTVYDSFRYRKGMVLLGMFFAFLLFLVSGALSRNYPSAIFTLLTFTSLAGLIAGAYLLRFSCRCPRCQNVLKNDIPVSCPNCGLNLSAVDRDQSNI